MIGTDIDFQAVSSGKKVVHLRSPKVKRQEPEIIEGALVIQVMEAKALIDAYLPTAQAIRAHAVRIKIKDDKTKAQASETGTRIKNLVKEINLAVENVIKDPDKFVKEIKNIAKKIIVELEIGKRYLANELLKDKQRQDLERAKREEAIRKADEARKKKLSAEYERLKIKTPVPVPEETKLPKKTKDETQTRTNAGLSFAKGEWTYELLNIDELEDKYIIRSENKKLINTMIKQGLRDELNKKKEVVKAAIPGIRIYYKEDIAFR